MYPAMMTLAAIDDQVLIAQQVFLSMVNMDMARASDHTTNGEQVIASLLEYSEPSEGTILLECTPSLAYAFTARLMQVPTPAHLDEDVSDAMSELVNMIGGNLKGLMPEETCVSLPSVLAESDRLQLLHDYPRLSRVCMTGVDGHLCISLFGSVAAA